MALITPKSLTIRSTWVNDSCAVALAMIWIVSYLIDPFFEKICLTAIDASCHSRTRIDLELPRRLAPGSSSFQIIGCS